MTKKLTAAERIKVLEKMVDDLNQDIQQLAGLNNTNVKNIQTLLEQNEGFRQALSALARRLNATIQSGEKGTINNEAVNQVLVDENIRELKSKVDLLKKNGIIEEDPKGTVGERTFLIGREINKEGEEINPRMQFAVASLTPEGKEKVNGRKKGDVVDNFSGDGSNLEIKELYHIAEEKPQKKEFEGEEEV